MNRIANARWNGDLKTGKGQLEVGSGAFKGPYSFISRFEGSGDTNPEELLGAAHAGCFSMALSLALTMAGHVPTEVATTATVDFDKVGAAFAITSIDLVTRGTVPGISAADFVRLATETKANCIVSKALAAVPMTLDAKLIG